jgi:hypothetical protein
MPMSQNLVKERYIKAKLEDSPLDIRYRKKNGKFVRRRIEPYELKSEAVYDDYGYRKIVTYLYGYDITPGLKLEKKVIKRWIISQFDICRVMPRTTFKPRWFV